MDRFQEMQVFVRIAERGSSAQAADDLRIPRATVTNLLERMKERLACAVAAMGLIQVPRYRVAEEPAAVRAGPRVRRVATRRVRACAPEPPALKASPRRHRVAGRHKQKALERRREAPLQGLFRVATRGAATGRRFS